MLIRLATVLVALCSLASGCTVDDAAAPEPTPQPTVDDPATPEPTPQPTVDDPATPEPTQQPTVDDPATPEPTQQPTVDDAATPEPTQSTVGHALAILPYPPEEGLAALTIVDYRRAFTSVGFDFDSLCDLDDDGWLDAVWEMGLATELHRGPFVLQAFIDPKPIVRDLRAVLDMSVCQIEAEVTGQVLGPNYPHYAFGDFDPAAAAAAARSEPWWSEHLDMTDGDDEVQLSWPTVDLRLTAPADHSPLFGVGLRRPIAMSPTHMTYGHSGLDPMSNVTISDVEPMREIAMLLAERSAHEIHLMEAVLLNLSEPPFVDVVDLRAPETSLEDLLVEMGEPELAPGLAPWHTAGLGVAVEDGELVGYIVLAHHRNERSAQNADRLADALRRPGWPSRAEPFLDDTYRVDIDVEGHLTIARITGQDGDKQISTKLQQLVSGASTLRVGLPLEEP